MNSSYMKGGLFGFSSPITSTGANLTSSTSTAFSFGASTTFGQNTDINKISTSMLSNTFDSGSAITSPQTSLVTSTNTVTVTPTLFSANASLSLLNDKTTPVSTNDAKKSNEPPSATSAIKTISLEEKTSITFNELLEIVNKYALDLNEQSRLLVNQGRQIQEWDCSLQNNSKIIVELNDSFQEQQAKQSKLNYALDSVGNQQKELESVVQSFEKIISEKQDDDYFNRNFYKQAEIVDSKLQKMKEDLKDINENIGVKVDKEGLEEENDTNGYITRILHLFVCSLESLDKTILELEDRVKTNANICKIYESKFNNVFSSNFK